MLHKLTSAVANTGLLAVVLLLLAGPLVLGSMLVTNQTGALGVATDQPSTTNVSQTTEPIFSVAPNTTDFNQYAQFGREPMVGQDTYQTSVTFTAFTAQIASYNGLISLVNTSTQPHKFAVQVGKLSGDVTHSRIWLTLSPEGRLASSLLTQAGKAGDKQLTVSDTVGLTGSQIVAGTAVVSASIGGPTQLNLAQPLVSALPVGEKVYFGPAYYFNAVTPTVDTTQTIELQPQGRAVIDMVVATDAGQPTTTQAVMPLVISALP